MTVATNVLELIGNTPIVKLNKLVGKDYADIYVKLEYFNPGGSVKDRPALYMIEKAEEEGKLKKGYVIVEPTSGNTGVGLAMVGAAKGYKVILVMPETMSIERRNLFKAFGAEVVLTPGSNGMKGAVDKAEELAKQNSNYYIPYQFGNENNTLSHIETTAQEILKDLGSNIDVFIAGIGTGGTVTGVGKVLKEKNSNVKIVGVEPKSSPLLSEGKAGPHKIQGIGANFVPSILDLDLLDDINTVFNEDAIETTRQLAREEGILVGISSGAAVYAALQWAKKLGKGKTVLAIAPDNGERYLSTGIFS
ncbi:cysteine synthase A [Acidilutibacter cellobiosedens]|uniref:Cysteine synthase n=1 Tax=Acidilutibacter cellobiosedens TaxID=2507161 RepID=A0A410QFH6_9FIRM|nr:cysteine synthase A [Acidilutibacter cellobiosedens]MBE6082893.1 cysteine synthase A [Tissierellaceae bacterium]QAT62578.1 cysteine synthase A [Acidilutibacter cellobiosedens]